ncbi:MAG: chloramphenicol phosphotransferase [Cereibacter sphaeroides]|uniref:Chloramphenicol phosphotransferase n=1 Tax=Cereibacter sphaeroides TaxID=1063 RepID=A0A2W5TUH8_CERSP|nr:MAG: chloramphenicol phosphotransferase [Cereibacter sphaeroides]
MDEGRIIVLNGVGSVGKSSVARAMQKLSPVPLLHVQMDSFLEMLPEALQDGPEGFAYREGPHGVQITSGPAGQRLIRGMHHAVAALAGQGNRLIFDTVMEARGMEECRRLFTPLGAFFVGLMAPLEVIEARELARGDRMIGLARWQYGRMPEVGSYDLAIDMTQASPNAAARQVLCLAGI